MGIRSLAAELLPTTLLGLQRASASAPAPVEAQSFDALTAKLGYLSKAELRQVREAYKFADEAHLGQYRASGQPYITHPIAVAGLCADWKLDVQAIMAALMHDTIEDQGVTKTELIERFGAPTADLVDGLTKLDKLQFNTREEGQAESFRKMLLAMARDVRVILVKLADRLHNMRTMKAMASDKAPRIARETLDIYAPIAHRLGLNEIYRELQDLSFEHLHPWRRAALAKAVKRSRGYRRDIVERVQQGGPGRLREGTRSRSRSRGARRRSTRSTARCARSTTASRRSTTSSAFASSSPRSTSATCALGVLHQLYKPVPGRFKDYIAIPKANGYQSLHTTLVSPLGTPVEFQLRTEAMHAVAEKGIAAHWLYKIGDKARHGGRRAAPGHDVAAVPARHPGRDARLDRVPRARQDRPVPRRGLRLHAQEQDPGAAARRDAGGLRLRHPLRRRRPHGGRAQVNGEPVALRTELQERRRRRGHHRARRAAQPGLAEPSCAPAVRAPRSATT